MNPVAKAIALKAYGLHEQLVDRRIDIHEFIDALESDIAEALSNVANHELARGAARDCGDDQMLSETGEVAS